MRSDAEERLALAADPATPAAMLNTLAQDAALAPIVAANPNIAPDTFERLMVWYPIACGTNPALPLMALVDPAMLTRFVKDHHRALDLLTAPQTLPSVLWAMNQHADDEVRETLRYHVAMLSEADATAERRDDAIRHTCFLLDRYHTKLFYYFNDALPSVVPAIWLSELLTSHDSRTILTRIRALPPSIVLALAEHADQSSVAVLLARSDLSAGVFTRLVERNDVFIDTALVADPRITSDHLMQIATDEHCYLRASRQYAEGKYPEFFSHAVVKQSETAHLDREKVVALNLVRNIQYRAAMHPNCSAELLDLLAQKRTAPVQLRRAIAAHPRTRIATLQRLAHDDNRHVRQIVARHPHFTADLVAVLLADQDLGVRHALAHNAHLTLLLLGQIVAQGDPFTRGQVAERASVPLTLFALLAQDHENTVRHAVASAADVPPALLRNLLTDSDPLVRQRAARHPSLPREQIAACCASDDVAMRRAIANNPSLTTEQIVLLAADEDLRVRYHALRHPSLPATLLPDAAQHAAVEVRLRAAEHPELLGELVDLLAGDPEIAVRRAIFGHPHLSADGLERLVAFDDEQMRYAVLRHSLINETILLQLAHDPRDDIRMRVLKHPAATAAVQRVFVHGTRTEYRSLATLRTAYSETLEALLGIGDPKLNNAIVCNPATPWNILESLQDEPTLLPFIAKHPNTPLAFLEQIVETRPDLYNTIIANPNTSTEILDRIAVAPQTAPWEIARHPNISLTLAATFVTHSDATTRSAVASNLAVPEELLWPLAHDTEIITIRVNRLYGNNPICATLAQRVNLSDALAHVLLEVPQTHTMLAMNQSCSADIYHYLALHGNWLVLKYLFSNNPNMPLDLHIMLRAVFDEPLSSLLISNELGNNVRQEILTMCARSSRVDLRLKAATHPLTSAHLLLYLASDGQMRVRQSVAEHSDTPPAALARLACDANKKVRAAAHEHRNTPLSALVARPYSIDEFNALPPLTPPPSFEIPSTLTSPFIPMPQYAHWLQVCIEDGRQEAMIHNLLLSSASTPPEALFDMAGSNSWLERYIIARHPNTPPEIIQRLCDDTNRFVRIEARTRVE